MNFTELPNGMVDGFVLLKKCEEKKTKNGSEHLWNMQSRENSPSTKSLRLSDG